MEYFLISSILILDLFIIIRMVYEYRTLRKMYDKYRDDSEYRKIVIENGYLFDWIGRVYRVLPIPNEFKLADKQAYILEQITYFTELAFTKNKLVDFIIYEVEELNDVNHLILFGTYRYYFRKRFFVFLLLSIIGVSMFFAFYK